MAWVKFWSRFASNTQTAYKWYDDLPDGDTLSEDVKTWVSDDGGYPFGTKCGFEVLEKLPEEERQELIKNYESEQLKISVMLKRLRG